jgi:hypothetical protein
VSVMRWCYCILLVEHNDASCRNQRPTYFWAGTVFHGPDAWPPFLLKKVLYPRDVGLCLEIGVDIIATAQLLTEPRKIKNEAHSSYPSELVQPV